MIDFVKCEIQNCNTKRLEQNQYLDFIDEVNASTGELGKYKVGRYKGLKFVIYYPTTTNPFNRVTVAGSLHKYWNDGKHNFNDFGIEQIEAVLKDLERKFSFHPQNCILKSIEIGVNITPPTKTETVLSGCILHKTIPFEPNTYTRKGNFVQARKQQYIIKVYDKKMQYQENGYNGTAELLRFEIRYLKMQPLKQLKIYTMQDILDFGIENFKPILLEHWRNILFYETEALRNIKKKYHYNNPKYWKDLKKENFKYHRRNLNKLIEINNGTLKSEVHNLIDAKVKLLAHKPPEITL